MPRPPARCALCEDGTHQTYPVRELPDGRKVHVRLCPCGRVTELTPAETPGLVCLRCGDVRVLVTKTRHPRPGVTVREAKCHFCGAPDKTITRRRLTPA